MPTENVFVGANGSHAPASTRPDVSHPNTGATRISVTLPAVLVAQSSTSTLMVVSTVPPITWRPCSISTEPRTSAGASVEEVGDSADGTAVTIVGVEVEAGRVAGAEQASTRRSNSTAAKVGRFIWAALCVVNVITRGAV